MLILGLGHDMIVIERIENSLSRFGDRFTHRLFTERERAKCDRRKLRAASYAKRFAAKEACSKALGTGLRQGVFWRHMEVVNLPSGKPTFQLHGGAQARLQSMVPEGFVPQINLTISDDNPYAVAHVIISALPEDLAHKAGLTDGA